MSWFSSNWFKSNWFSNWFGNSNQGATDRTSSDNVAVVENATKQTIHVRSVSDDVVIVDEATKQTVHVRNVNDSVAVIDEAVKPTPVAGSVSFTFTIQGTGLVVMPITTQTSYVTLDDATAFFAGRVDSSIWDSSDNNLRTKALIQASATIDRLNYLGNKLVNTQVHEFPRDWQNVQLDEVLYDTDDVPLDVKYAVCLQAEALLGGFDINQEIDGLIVVSDGYSAVKTTYDRTSIPRHFKAGVTAEVWQLISRFIRDPRSVSIKRT